ncbi:3D domain-containing protein [Candidatus Thiosymbion oneisti]|uniref:3D domain-containing protein n=1 Tax=Candidatus Thiosymbion oneisti TaxID=589554 RepID=UPI000B7C638F|nr:3D domain-containing protein [Candidatus Thiosymbion oneisti]
MNRSVSVALLVFAAIVTPSGCSSHRSSSNTESSPEPALTTPTAAESEKAGATSLSKRQVDQFLAPSCERIAQSIEQGNEGYREEQIRKATQYFTPMFEPGQDGGLRGVDRKACINIEGSCIVGEWLYNYAGPSRPWGNRYDRSVVPFKFGKGSGQSQYNTMNALDPCRTLAADKNHYPSGTVVYIPSMKQKKCPQTGKVVDGCFIVGDVGSAITGAKRFDIFTGECLNYSKRSNTCRDSLNREFVAPKETTYYVVNRDNNIAKELRQETDNFIRSNWRTVAD